MVERSTHITRLRRASCLIALICAAIAGCSDPYSASIENINFREDGEGFRRFHADIPGYFNRGFIHFLYDSRQTPMAAVRSEVKKLSGFADVGYGIVYCLQNNGDYYRVLIKTDGTYSVTRKLGGVKTSLIDWTPGEYLLEGYDVVNEIQITYYSPMKRFTVYFNEVAETSFVDVSFSGGYAGFYAVIGPEELERFPDEPVDIRFRQILPIPDPQ
jgi:hypothetical protein